MIEEGRSDDPSGFRIRPGLQLSSTPDLKLLPLLVNQWIANCQSNHRACKILKDTDFSMRQPKRVLDIDGVASTGQVQLRTLGSDLVLYVALSHCWGGGIPARTVKDNLETRLRGFSVAELPQNFRDAIQVTRSLGIRFLWIDSLCIIQDDADDWEQEAVNMGSVYTHAYLTIAATRSPDSESGFLEPRNGVEVVQMRVKVTCCVSKTKEYQYSLGLETNYSDMAGPLTTRAWAFQERILSPRILHFTKSGIFWDCWTDYDCENLCTTWDVQKDIHTRSASYPDSLSPAALGAIHDPYRKDTVTWTRMVEKYMQSNLTKESDRLVAIKSLMDRIAPSMFCKGVRTSKLHQDLFWAAQNGELQFVADTKAPSWSWASRKGPIKFLIMNEVHAIDYEEEESLKIINAPGRHNELPKLEANILSFRPRVHLTFSSPNVIDHDSGLIGRVEFRFTGAKYRRIVEEGIGLGWAIMDKEHETEPDIRSFYWVHIASAKESAGHEASWVCFCLCSWCQTFS